MASKSAYRGPTHTHAHPNLGSLTGRLHTRSRFPSYPVVQFRSIPYAHVPRRFAPSVLLDSLTPPPRPNAQDTSSAKAPTVESSSSGPAASLTLGDASTVAASTGHDARHDDNDTSRPAGQGTAAHDFTVFTAACPQVGATMDYWDKAPGGKTVEDDEIYFDEFDCCNLTVCSPEDYLDTASDDSSSSSTQKLLPVMVYIHGGGMQEGNGAVDGTHEASTMCAYAASVGMPTVIVNVEYRLNWFGNLVCGDILEEYEEAKNREEYPGGPFNLHLQDQRNAFLWVKRYIRGFGGDPENVTAFGESAGSTFLCCHACSDVPVFEKVVLQSGAVMGTVGMEVKEMEYQGLLKKFGIEGKTAMERLEKLRKVDQKELAFTPGAHYFLYTGPLPSGEPQPLFERGEPTHMSQMKLIRECPWLGDIMLGDDFYEGAILIGTVKESDPGKFIDVLKSSVGEEMATKLLTTYHIPASGEIDANLFWYYLTLFAGDVLLSDPMHRLANALVESISGPKRKVYRYSFGLTNPFLGSDFTFVTGHHFVDMLFLFCTLLDRYPHHRGNFLERQALETARKWVTFAHGQEPWDEYRGDRELGQRKIAICDDLRGWEIRTVAEDAEVSKSDPWGERRYAGWEVFGQVYDSLRTENDTPSTWEDKVNQARLAILNSASYCRDILKIAAVSV